ncbi:hypothetical protein BC828DRAFT_377154 [Blastocladiella britannica]|nr:hypothetical protein BC828DRAFT_377154 [Blastocladiella britannica]
MAQLRPIDEPSDAAAVHASDVHTTDKSGLAKRKAAAAAAGDDEEDETTRAPLDAEDTKKQVAAVAEEEQEFKTAPRKTRQPMITGWKRQVGLCFAWAFIYGWIILLATMATVFMNLWDCSQAQMKAYEEFGIEAPYTYMMTCDFNGVPDLAPYSLPDNPPPYALPEPLCLQPCQRESIVTHYKTNFMLPFEALGDHIGTTKIVARNIWRMVYRWGYRLYRNIKTSL